MDIVFKGDNNNFLHAKKNGGVYLVYVIHVGDMNKMLTTSKRTFVGEYDALTIQDTAKSLGYIPMGNSTLDRILSMTLLKAGDINLARDAPNYFTLDENATTNIEGPSNRYNMPYSFVWTRPRPISNDPRARTSHLLESSPKYFERPRKASMFTKPYNPPMEEVD